MPRTGAMTGAKLIGGDSSSGKSGDWSDIKWLRAAGYSHITLFKLRVEVQRIVEEKLANHDASSHIVDEATDKEVLRSHDDRMVEEKPAKPSRAPYRTPSACANRAAYPEPPPVVPDPESIDAQASYRGRHSTIARLSPARIVSRHWGPPRACHRVPCCE